jgi:electron transport complex protein RnfG
MKMNISAHMIIVLTIVCLFSGLSLVYMNQYTEPLVEKNKEEETKEAIFTVLSDVESIEEIEKDDMVVYKGFDKEDKLVGYAFVAEGSGYQGVIKIMVGIDSELEKLTGIDILESVETPGLGAKIMEDDFKKQFQGIKVSPEIKYVKGKEPEEDNEIQAITGATVSSRSVVNILNTGIEKVKEILEDNESSDEEDVNE